jgi:AraC family transcriptional regulator, positive regulator of tynA and feaB
MSEARLWTTSAAPGKELAYWRMATCEAVFELELETFDADAPLAASIRHQQLGAISLSRMAINAGQVIRRTSTLIGRSRRAQLELVHLLEGHIFLRHYGREVEMGPGKCILVDSREPYELTTAPGSRNTSFHLPVEWLQRWLPQPEASVAKPIDTDSPWGRALLASICATSEDSPGEWESLCAEQIAGALTLAVDRNAPSPSGSAHSRRLFNRLRRTLVDFAHDNSIDARRVASKHNISVRYLHAVFASAGTTYSHELLRIRLERAARMLREPRLKDLSVADIAWRCAFYDASHLTRHFRHQYGCTPGAYRTS